MSSSIPASLYLWSNRVFTVINGGSRALFEGFWMGLLSEASYDVISEKSYGQGKEYTHTAYLDQGFHFWEEMTVKTSFKPGSRVLVAAAGGGRELIALARSGFEAAGFECCRPMVQAGQRALSERNIAATLEWAPPCTAPHVGGHFEALIIGWNGYSYIAPRARRIGFMKTLAEQLRPGSPVLVSTAIRYSAARLAVWTPRVANAIRICTFRPPVFEPGDSFPGRPKMHFTRRQLEAELAEAGFAVTGFYEWGGYGAAVARLGDPSDPGNCEPGQIFHGPEAIS